MRTPVLLLAFMVCWNAGSSQKLSPEVIAAAGVSAQANQVQLDWTLGELSIQTIQNAAGQLTQGFHQPVFLVSSTAEIPEAIGRVTVFPNPASGWITLHWVSGQSRQIQLRLSNAQGIILWQTREDVCETTLKKSLSGLPAGAYFLLIQVDGSPFYQTFNIQKIN